MPPSTRKMSLDLAEWFFTSVHGAGELIARKSRAEQKHEAEQTPHQEFVLFLHRNGLDDTESLQSIYNQLRDLPRSEIAIQFSTQWNAYLKQIHGGNLAYIKNTSSLEPNFFDNFVRQITFANCFDNILWGMAGLFTDPLSLYNTLSTAKPLVTKGKRKFDSSTTTTGGSKNVTIEQAKEFIDAMAACAQTDARITELHHWCAHTLKPAADAELDVIKKARCQVDAGIIDGSDLPSSAPKFDALVKKTQETWTDLFSDSKFSVDEVKDAIAQIGTEAGEVEKKHFAILITDHTTTAYLSKYLDYLIATSLELNTSTLAAALSLAADRFAHLAEGAEAKICAEDQSAFSRAVDKRRKVELTQLAESKDIRGLRAQLNKHSQQLLDAKQRLLAEMPNVHSFKTERATAFDSAIYLDYARWVKHLVSVANSNSELLIKTAGTSVPERKHQEWLLKHEQEVRDKAAAKVVTQRRRAVDIADTATVSIRETLEFYDQVMAKLTRQQTLNDKQFMLVPRPWSDWQLTSHNIVDLRATLKAQMIDTKQPQHMAPKTREAFEALMAFASGERGVEAATFKAIEAKLRQFMLGAESVMLFPDQWALI